MGERVMGKCPVCGYFIYKQDAAYFSKYTAAKARQELVKAGEAFLTTVQREGDLAVIADAAVAFEAALRAARGESDA